DRWRQPLRTLPPAYRERQWRMFAHSPTDSRSKDCADGPLASATQMWRALPRCYRSLGSRGRSHSFMWLRVGYAQLIQVQQHACCGAPDVAILVGYVPQLQLSFAEEGSAPDTMIG